MITNFKLVIEYDGSGFYGWQRQNNKPTIQGEIEKNLSTIFDTSISITGSGRTDAGVHARGQAANFKADTALSPDRIKRALNSMIKAPIVILDCSVVPLEFHSQYHAVSKEYHYMILNREDPCAIGRNYVWHIRKRLDISPMNECCQMILGDHDFKSFENTGSPRSSTVRKVFHAGFEPLGKDRIVFKIRANGFLRNMVRNLVGTLVPAGMNKIKPSDFHKILKACDRNAAGTTAPASGLFLNTVSYS